jgi:hypothetical protein
LKNRRSEVLAWNSFFWNRNSAKKNNFFCNFFFLGARFFVNFFWILCFF